jgi:zinc protease
MLLCFSVNVANAVNIEKLNTDITDRALYTQQKEVPTVNILLSFKAGTIFEHNYAHGTANLLANLVSSGSTTKTAQQIQDELDKLSSVIYVYSSRDEIKMEITSIEKNIEPTLAILQDILSNATFPQRELDILTSSVKQAIEQQNESPNVLSFYKARREFYGENNIKAYVSNLGTMDSIDEISQESLMNFYKEYITKENVSISVVSSLDKVKIEELLNTYLSSMNIGARKELIKPIPKGETNRTIIQKDIPQTTVLLYNEGITRIDPDYYTSVVFNYILGSGGFSSRLMEELREKRGLTYGVKSAFEYDLPYKGLFTISLQTKNDNKYKAESLIRKELGNMLNAGVSQKEVDDAKSFLLGSFPMQIRTSDKLLAYLNVMQKFDLNTDYLNDWGNNIQNVTLEEVNAFAKKIIQNEIEMSRVFVGGM